MENKRCYSIKEISELMNIPKATIRYWDSEGLITPERNPQNLYREFPMTVAMELSNISFFRNIGIPVKELKRIMKSDISVQEELLKDAEYRLEEKMKELQRQAERIRRQKYALSEIQRLKKQELMPGKPLFNKVVEFHYFSEKHWQKIIENPGAFVLLFEAGSNKKYTYGIGYLPKEEPSAKEHVIWTGGNTEFYEGLLITDNQDESQNNMITLWESVCSKGHLPGTVIAQYLTSGVKGQNDVWDYYKTWLEVK